MMNEVQRRMERLKNMGLLNERGSYRTRFVEDGRVIDLVPLTFGRARLIVSPSVTASVWTDGW
jgi:hypothetical protein